MLAQKSLTINNKPFVIQTLPATKGIEAAVVLSHIIAGAANGIGSHKQDWIETDINIAKIVGGLFERLDIDKTPLFIKELVLLSVITPKLDGETYEAEFAGQYEMLTELLVAIFEHNKFLDLIKKKVAGVMGLLSVIRT